MSLHGYDKKLPILISLFMVDVNTRKRILNIFFCEIIIDTVPEDLTPEKLANFIAEYNEMEKLQRSVKQRELAFFLIKIITSAEREVKVSRRSGMYQSCNFLTRWGKQSL